MSTLTWESLPETISVPVQEHTGQVVKAEPTGGGLMPGLTAVLHTDDGPRWFLKAAPEDSPAYLLHGSELSVNSALPCTVPAPRMRCAFAQHGWVVMVFDHVEGRDADLSPRSPDLPAVMSLIRAVGSVPAWESLPPVDVHVAALQEKASRMLGRLDGERRDLYTRALDGFDITALAGDRLLHYDLHGGNLRVDEHDDVLALDWSFGCAGAPGVEVAFLMPRLIVAGHTSEEAETRVSGMRSWHRLDDETTTGLAALWTLFRIYKAEFGPEAARPARRRAADAGEAWVRYRLG